MNQEVGPANLAIIALTCLISYKGFMLQGVVDRYMFDVQLVLRGKQYYRLLTSGLLHGNWPHLGFNMFSLFSFGTAIELGYGILPFLIIYIASILGGGLLSLLLYRNYEYRALGASGGVCGIIFACIFLIPDSSVYIFMIPFPIPAHIFAILFIIFSYIGLRAQAGNIGHGAHLGGAIIGLLVTTAMYPRIVMANPTLYFGVIGLSVSIMLLLYFYPLHSARRMFKPIEWQPEESPQQNKEPVHQDETDEQIIERLLEKVSKHGINSLDYIEKGQLETISKKRKQRQSNTDAS